MTDLDSDKYAEGIFTDTYWKLHRNALFFGAFTLLLSIPDVRIDNSATSYAIKIGPLGGRVICWFIFSTAIYSISVFLLEWMQQALPYLQTRYAQFKNFTKDEANRVDRYITATEDLRVSIQNCQSSISSFVEGAQKPALFFGRGYVNYPISDQGFPSVKPSLVMQLTEFERIKNSSFFANSPDKNQIINSNFESLTNRIEQAIDQIDEKLSKFATEYDDLAKNLIIGSASSIFEENSRKLADFLELDFQIQSLKSWSKFRLKVAQKISLSDFVRVFVFGLLLPICVCAVAFAHFFGKFVCPIFSSWIF